MEDLTKIKLMETTKDTFAKINDNFAKVEEAVEDVEGNFDNYIPASQKGQANGVATLDSNGRVPSGQLPSYVDDVLEYASKSNFPATGESGKIYVALDTNLTYRWGGSEYVEISQSLALGETASTAYAGNKGKQNADDIATLKSYFIEGGGATPFSVGQTYSAIYYDTSKSIEEMNALLAEMGEALIMRFTNGEFVASIPMEGVYTIGTGSTFVYVSQDYGSWSAGWQPEVIDYLNQERYASNPVTISSATNPSFISATQFGGAKAKDADKLDGHDTSYFQQALQAQTAYSGKGTSTKVAKITTNSLGQVTAVEEVDIDFSSVDTKTTYTFTASDSRYSALQDGVYTLTIQNTNKYPIACYNANGEAVMVTLGQANNTITMKTDEKFAGTIVAL